MAIYYIGMLVIFTVIAAVVYNVQYERSRKGLKKYFSRLNKLERIFITARRKESKYGGYNGGFIRTQREF